MIASLVENKPAQNLEAERYVISAAFREALAVDEVSTTLGPDDFYRTAHATVWRAIVDLHKAGKPIEPASVQIYLRQHGLLEAVGGVDELVALENAAPTKANAVYFANLVAEAAQLRAAQTALNESWRLLSEPSLTPVERLSRVEEKVFAATRLRTKEAEVVGVGAVLAEVFREYEARKRDGRKVGMGTGISELDHFTGGMHPGEVTIVGGRPGQGKTSLAMNVVRHQALEKGTATLVVSLEMDKAALSESMLCQIAQVDSRQLRDGALDPDGETRFLEAAERLATAPIEIFHGACTPSGVRSLARRARAASKLGLLVVDYVQLLAAEDVGYRRPRHEEVADMSRSLKALAVDLGVPVLCLAALNRQSEGRVGYKPRLADLRESGALEADAALVLLIHSEKHSETDPAKREALGQGDDTVVVVAKNRYGRVGEVEIDFDRPTGHMTDRGFGRRLTYSRPNATPNRYGADP